MAGVRPLMAALTRAQAALPPSVGSSDELMELSRRALAVAEEVKAAKESLARELAAWKDTTN